MFKRLMNNSGNIKPMWWIRLLIIIVTIGTDLFSAIVIAKTADAVLQGNRENMGMLIIYGAICLILEILLNYMNKYLGSQIKENAMKTYRVSVLSKYLNGRYDKTESWRVGEALTRMQEDTAISASYLVDSIPNIVKLGARILIIGTVLSAINVWMLLAVAGFYPLCIFIQAKVSKPLEKKQGQMMEAGAQSGALTQSVLNQTKNVRAYNLIDYAVKKYSAAQEKYCRAFMDFVNIYTAQLPISSLVGIIPQLLLYGIGGLMVSNKSMTIPVFLMFAMLAEPLTSFLVDSFQSIQGIRQASAGVKRLFQIWDIPDEENVGNAIIDEVRKIAIENVSFSYAEAGVEDKRNTAKVHAVNNVSFVINSGEKVAIVGKSGSGKSTLAKLLAGFYAPNSGKILLNDIETSQIDINNLHKNVMIVPQTTMLISGTAEENIAFYESFDTKSIEKAMKKAEILELKGKKLHIENGNNTVSGGQAQRLAIARAYLRKPPLIIFDEPLSALDPENAAKLQDSILAMNGTIIEITHRLEKVESFDKIVVMADGKVVEIGTYEELFSANGHLCQLIGKGAN